MGRCHSSWPRPFEEEEEVRVCLRFRKNLQLLLPQLSAIDGNGSGEKGRADEEEGMRIDGMLLLCLFVQFLTLFGFYLCKWNIINVGCS